MLNRTLCLALVFSLLISVVYSGKTSALTTQVLPAHAYGIAAGGGLPSLSDSALASEMAGINAMGATWIRFDFNWSQIQPTNSTTYDWFETDRVVAAAQQQGLNVLGIIDYAPSWASVGGCSNSNCAPANPRQFATFASSVASRYKSKVSDWEIWNEENSSKFWGPSANVAIYASLLKLTYASIKAVNPLATVIVGGLAQVSTSAQNISPSDFLQGLYAGGVGSYFDAVGDHPYTYPSTPDSTNSAWNNMSIGTNSLRSIMIANGDSAKKIWITEYGAPTAGPSSSDYVNQADMLIQAASMYQSYSWVGPFFWYSYQDQGTATDTSQNFFGLLNSNGSPKPAYAVFNLYAKGYL